MGSAIRDCDANGLIVGENLLPAVSFVLEHAKLSTMVDTADGKLFGIFSTGDTTGQPKGVEFVASTAALRAGKALERRLSDHQGVR